MKIALLGYGRMGQAIEKIAIDRGHTIVAKIDKDNPDEAYEADVAINFSVPMAAYDNITVAIRKGIPVVCGTTGWLDQLTEVEALCQQSEGAFLYASPLSSTKCHALPSDGIPSARVIAVPLGLSSFCV